ncbi:MAG: cysteine desulfurase NifS [Oscillospiraceae bacterium]|nr:cysteine desulfurase NifS [Oscillospiraceae bacterium]MCM0708240.1 cysteine desulfurase NifS [Faecalicatena sp. BF-R-105]MDY3218653.1 cysteine desulfurase NifS [Candidatus Fimivivens sp.]SFJ38400.1 cysteine desulfurase [Ruminococcaceae bacterium D5]GKH50929.1 cysteine desulfurase IscS [Eubacteriales bacterium]
MEKRFVYADHSATTPISKPVLNAMLPYLTEGYGNPSSIYSKGREAKKALESARGQVAEALHAKPSEIYFTSCGTESDNWAIKGAAAAGARKGKRHLITTNFEHHAVLHTMQMLEKEGFEVTYLPVDSQGLITAAQVREAIRPDTALVSIMYANNEIGTILPIPEIGAVCREARVPFHTDAVQAVGQVAIDVGAQQIDMLSLSGHKLNAPKGVGVLYLRSGLVIDTFMHGGAQERGRRAGTENLASIMGLAAAITIASFQIEERAARRTAMRDRLIDGILGQIPRCRLNGSREHRLPGSLNISFEGIEGESLLLLLDMKGVCASSGSACTSGSLDPSHVLLAIGLPHEIAHGSLRLSLGDENTMEDVEYILEILPPIIERLRSMSPVWEKLMAEQRAQSVG